MEKTTVIRRFLLVFVVGAALVVGGGAVALGHGILKSAQPEPKSEVAEPPGRVSTTLTEAPLPDGRYVVRDGCDRVVSSDYEIDGDTISARVTDGRPGNWKVRFDFISSVDGHRYNQMYSFTVAGKKDCSEPEDEEDADDAAAESPGASHGDGDTGEAAETDDTHGDMGGEAPADESRIPVVPLAATSVAALGLAVLGRRPSSSG